MSDFHRSLSITKHSGQNQFVFLVALVLYGCFKRDFGEVFSVFLLLLQPLPLATSSSASPPASRSCSEVEIKLEAENFRTHHHGPLALRLALTLSFVFNSVELSGLLWEYLEFVVRNSYQEQE